MTLYFLKKNNKIEFSKYFQKQDLMPLSYKLSRYTYFIKNILSTSGISSHTGTNVSMPKPVEIIFKKNTMVQVNTLYLLLVL